MLHVKDSQVFSETLTWVVAKYGVTIGGSFEKMKMKKLRVKKRLVKDRCFNPGFPYLF